MKKLFFCFIVFVFISCNQAFDPAEHVIISGKIKNAKKKEFTLTTLDRKISVKLKLDKKGYFADTIKTIKQTFVLFEKFNKVYLELKPGDNLILSADAKRFPLSLKFSGVGSDINNYLTNRHNLFLEESKSNVDKYSKHEKEFIKYIKQYKEKAENLLISCNCGLSEEFIRKEKKNIYYKYYLDLYIYPNRHLAYSENKTCKISENYSEHFKNIDWNNEQDYKDSEYYRYLVSYYIGNSFNNQRDTTKDWYISIIKFINKEVSNQYIKDQLLFEYSKYNITFANDLEDFYKEFKKGVKDKKIKKDITNSYKKLKVTVKGKPSPKFEDYESSDGKKVSLKDYRGKYLFIDVWACWCTPCTIEIPFMKKLIEKYKGKNIEFISISIDKQKDKSVWEKMIREENLNWTQLLADNDWNSDFIQKYLIKAIPRYIIVDPEGKIITANAPRPSKKALGDLLSTLDL